MAFLGIETSTPICSVALFDEDKVYIERTQTKDRSHSALLTRMISEVLKESSLNTQDLRRIYVSDGPGSYTGLRIGASVAKGICFAHDIPIYTISGLKASACRSYHDLQQEGVYLGSADARRDDVYLGGLAFPEKEEVDPCMETLGSGFESWIDQFGKKNIYISGEGAVKMKEYELPENVKLIFRGHCASNLFYAVKYDTDSQHIRAYMTFEPYYMQRPNITQSKKLQL